MDPGDIGEGCRLFETGADVNAVDKYGCTPLHHACRAGPEDMAVFLLQQGADPNARDDTDDTPLHWAVSIPGNTQTILCLLDAGSDINAKNKDGWTPLHQACYWNIPDAAGLLLKHGASFEVKDGGGNLPLDMVVKRSLEDNGQRQELLELFREYAPEQYFSAFCTAEARGMGL